MENEKKKKSWGGPWPCSAHKGLRPWADNRRFTYVDKHVDTLALGHVSKLNGVNDKIGGNDQIETFKI
jgi:hypothetical protein